MQGGARCDARTVACSERPIQAGSRSNQALGALWMRPSGRVGVERGIVRDCNWKKGARSHRCQANRAAFGVGWEGLGGPFPAKFAQSARIPFTSPSFSFEGTRLLVLDPLRRRVVLTTASGLYSPAFFAPREGQWVLLFGVQRQDSP